MKGDKGQECNRGACNNRPTVWYNRVMLKWYCGECARAINASPFHSGPPLLEDEYAPVTDVFDSLLALGAVVVDEQGERFQVCRDDRRWFLESEQSGQREHIREAEEMRFVKQLEDFDDAGNAMNFDRRTRKEQAPCTQ